MISLKIPSKNPSKFQLTCRWLVFSHYDGNVSPDHHKKWFVSLLWPQAKYGSKWLPRCHCSKSIETYRSSCTGRRRAHPRYFRFRRRPPPGLLPAVLAAVPPVVRRRRRQFGQLGWRPLEYFGGAKRIQKSLRSRQYCSSLCSSLKVVNTVVTI